MSCSYDLLDVLMDCAYDGKALSKEMNSDTISALSENNCVDIRIWAARALAYNDFNCVTIHTLCRLAKDEDAQVRVEAVDSLCGFSCPDSYAVMRSAILDSDRLVRAYAAFGVAVIGRTVEPESAQEILLCAEARDTDPRVLTGIYEGLYILEQKSAFDKLIRLFSSNDYHIKCAVLNALIEILNDENRSMVQSFINSIDLSICTTAVTDTLKRLRVRCMDMISE